MKKYDTFLNEFKLNELQFSAFDWDDNIFFMPTKIHMEHFISGQYKEISITTQKFSSIRKYIHEDGKWRFKNNDASVAFFDFGDRKTFVDEVRFSLENQLFAPSFNDFIKTLVNGELFAIITARTIDAAVLRAGVEIVVYEYLNDYQQQKMLENLLQFSEIFGTNPDSLIENYLDKCDYYGVTSKEFKRKFKLSSDASNPEEAKKMALTAFVKRVKKYGKQVDKKISVGFSDDDKANVSSIKKHFRELKKDFDYDFTVFNTSNMKMRKTKI